MTTMRLASLLDETAEADWVTAGMCGIHPSALSRYRNGTRAIPTKHAQKLAEHLGVTLDEVRARVEDPVSVDPF